MTRTDTEIILFAIALREQILAQQTCRVQAVSLDVDTETDRRRDIDEAPGIGLFR